MQDDSRRRRPRRRRGAQRQRPAQAPAEPSRPERDRPAPGRTRPASRRTRQRRARQPDELRPGSPAVILMDCREGEPDRGGVRAVFEGFFDLETGEPRRSGNGIPRLRVEGERVWGFECWWRPDPEEAGLTVSDRQELEASKRLLRALLRDIRRPGQYVRALPPR